MGLLQGEGFQIFEWKTWEGWEVAGDEVGIGHLERWNLFRGKLLSVFWYSSLSSIDYALASYNELKVKPGDTVPFGVIVWLKCLLNGAFSNR